MNSNRKTLIGVVGLFILLNGAIIWWRTSNSAPIPRRSGGDDTIKQQALQASTVALWQSLATTPFDEQSIRSALSNGRADECCSIPSRASPVLLEKLSEELKDDLTKAITDLLLLYAQNDPEKLLAYMAARNEFPTSTILDYAIEYLTDESLAVPGFKPEKDDPAALMLALWKGMRCHSHWSRLVADGMCLSIWELKGADPPELHTTAPRKPLFGNQATLTHHFAQREPSDPGATPHLIADLSVLIRHDEALKDLVAPWYFRFRFDRSDGKWHPVALIYVDPGFRGSDKEMVVLF